MSIRRRKRRTTGRGRDHSALSRLLNGGIEARGGRPRGRLDAALAEVKASAVPDPKASLARLDKMVALGKVGAEEYAVRQPKFAKPMAVAIASSAAMKNLTDQEIEDKWGEDGTAGDAVGVPLKSLGQFDETRAYLELLVSPSHAYIFLKKYQSTHKPAWIDKTADELTELGEHMKMVK